MSPIHLLYFKGFSAIIYKISKNKKRDGVEYEFSIHKRPLSQQRGLY